MAATEIQREAHCACALCQVPSVEKLPTFLATIALQCCKLNSIPKGEAETSPKGTCTLYHKPHAVREHAVRERLITGLSSCVQIALWIPACANLPLSPGP